MTHPIHSLQARYYTDPEIYAAEQNSLFANSWQFACHLSELPSAGSYYCFEIAGESLFAVRGRDEQVRVFYNVCQHRAHQLLKGAGRTPTLTCPYHAWSYDFEGYEHTVNSHINRLRAKIEVNPAKPDYVLTTWGVGYRFNDAE